MTIYGGMGRGRLVRFLLGAAFVSAVFFPAARLFADEPATPLADAAALWHFADPKDAAANPADLTVAGKARLGVQLDKNDAAASLLRGGDGLAADFADGGHFIAGGGTDSKLNIRGTTLSFYLRLRDPSGKWDCPIFSRHGGHDRLAYNFYSIGRYFGTEIGSTRNKRVLNARAPFGEMLDPATAAIRWHDVVVRLDGAKLELFVDGRCCDEDFLIGEIKSSELPLVFGGQDDGNDKIRDGFRGQIDTAAIWTRPLTDAEITTLSGGPEKIDSRQRTDRGNGESLQYWMPPNQYGVGDCMPFYADGVFHFMYLLDKGRHGAKNGLGAHQWIQATSTDLVHWTHQPFVVKIDRQNEGSICTGSVFYHDGTYYAFYANRSVTFPDDPNAGPSIRGLLCLSTSPDGIHFEKQGYDPILKLPEGYSGSTRDPVVFQDPRTKQFHLYATTSFKGIGCWAHAVSDDLKSWKVVEPVYTYKDAEPECPDWFEWGGTYYTIANHLNGFWRYSDSPAGPWDIPAGPNQLMTGIINVPKTAPFKDGRRIICGWTREHGFGGHAVFHELIRHDDGTLGEKFVPEMIPASGEPVLSLENIPDAERALNDLPPDARIRATLVFDPNERDSLRDWSMRYDGERALVVSPRRREVRLGAFILDGVDFSSGRIELDMIIKGDLFDLCVNGERTVTDALPVVEKRSIVLFNDAFPALKLEKFEYAPLTGAAK